MSERELYANLKTALQEVFRLYVGKGEGKISYKDLSEATGVDQSVLYDCNKAGTHIPNVARLLWIISNLPQPADAMDQLLKAIGLGARPLAGDICYFEAQAVWGDLLGVTSDALKDGRVDHLEELDIAQRAISAADFAHRARNAGGRKIAHTGSHNGYGGVLNVRS